MSIDKSMVPKHLIQLLKNHFNFTMDGAANKKTSLFLKYSDEIKPWREEEVVFCCPQSKNFKEYAENAANSKATSVLLIPARIDSRWWNSEVYERAAYISLLNKRIRWENAQFSWEPYCLAYYNVYRLPNELREFGILLDRKRRFT